MVKRTKRTYLLGHNASDVVVCPPVVLIVDNTFRRWTLLLWELEANIFVQRFHGHVGTRSSASTKHEVWGELGTSGGTKNILIMLGGQGSKTGSHETLRLRPSLMAKVREEVLRYLPVFVGRARSILHIFDHRTEVRGERIVISRESCGTKGRSLAVPSSILQGGSGKSRSTGKKNGSAHRKVRNRCLWSVHRSRE